MCLTHWGSTNQLRACVVGSQRAQERVQKLALQRLDSFAHVGLMEDLENSISSLAALTGLKMQGPAWRVGPPSVQPALGLSVRLLQWQAMHMQQRIGILIRSCFCVP